MEETVGYVLDVLRHPDGGFFSAEDADSEGVEGKFYCWSYEELEALCGDDFAEVVRVYGVTMRGNFEDPHTGFRGNILHAVGPVDTVPDAVQRVLPRLRARANDARPAGARRQGAARRGTRCSSARWPRPPTRSTAPTGWPPARANARFLLDAMRRDDGRLLRSWQDGRAAIPAFAEDHAALLEALLTLAEVDDVVWLADARLVADDLVRLFADDEHGGVHTTGIDADPLIVRPKDFQDNATPSENSMAANGFLRLGALTGDADATGRGHPLGADARAGAHRAPHRVRPPARSRAGAPPARHARSCSSATPTIPVPARSPRCCVPRRCPERSGSPPRPTPIPR